MHGEHSDADSRRAYGEKVPRGQGKEVVVGVPMGQWYPGAHGRLTTGPPVPAEQAKRPGHNEHCMAENRSSLLEYRPAGQGFALGLDVPGGQKYPGLISTFQAHSQTRTCMNGNAAVGDAKQ